MSTAAVSLLRAHLDQLRQGGRTTVPLDNEAREALAKLSGQKWQARPQAPAGRAGTLVHEATEPVTVGSLRQAVLAATQAAPAARPAAPPPVVTVSHAPPPAATPSIPSTSDVAWTVIDIPGATIYDKLNNLADMAEADPIPRALGTLRQTMVFAVGSPESRLMFVGEAPGEHEEQQREPFVGPAGQLLTKIIENGIGIPRSEVYISNICKFRPSTGAGQGSRNRAPTPEEMNACVRYIQTEIRLIRPAVIVALGATAATGLGIQGAVGRLRSRFHEVDGIPTMVTYHPSYILRQEQEGGGMTARRQVWEDMLMVMEKLGMPVSEKQRGYFKPKG